MIWSLMTLHLFIETNLQGIYSYLSIYGGLPYVGGRRFNLFCLLTILEQCPTVTNGILRNLYQRINLCMYEVGETEEPGLAFDPCAGLTLILSPNFEAWVVLKMCLT